MTRLSLFSSLVLILGISAALVGCSVPTATPTPTAIPTATPTPTPSVMQEWKLEDVVVNGSTVRVLLRVYAGIEIAVTLEDRKADEITGPAPVIEYVFLDVDPGKHTLNVRDVVGYSETREVEVPTQNSTGELPDWLEELIKRLEHEPVTNPPASVLQYEYKGETVYFVPQRCCDVFSDLYDSNGNVIAHPDGGITGQGDGRAPDFFQERTGEKLLWSDKREYDAALTQVLAPIESVEVLILESYPVQYMLKVVSGLPNGCARFAGYRVNRDGEVIRVEMVNWKPADQSTACTEEYRIVDTHIRLGIDFQSGEAYTVNVNETIATFIAQ